jgi:hypothetical protein
MCGSSFVTSKFSPLLEKCFRVKAFLPIKSGQSPPVGHKGFFNKETEHHRQWEAIQRPGATYYRDIHLSNGSHGSSI